MCNNKIKSICVFCGSQNGVLPIYKEVAKSLGKTLAQLNIRLVYGGGDVGLMGALAQAVKNEKGSVLGVIPTHLLNVEAKGNNSDDLIVTENMHERKKVMFMNSDAIIALPGGLGTLDELFEVLTWAQLELHRKPIFILNIDGFWEPLLNLITRIIKNEFTEKNARNLFKVFDNFEDLARDLKKIS